MGAGDANDAEAVITEYGEEEACQLAETLLAMQAETRAAKAAGATTYHDCTVKWLEWPYKPGCGGRWGDRRPTQCKEEHCTVVVKGKSAVVTPADGQSFRKLLSTTGFSFAPAKQEVANGCATSPFA